MPFIFIFPCEVINISLNINLYYSTSLNNCLDIFLSVCELIAAYAPLIIYLVTKRYKR